MKCQSEEDCEKHVKSTNRRKRNNDAEPIRKPITLVSLFLGNVSFGNPSKKHNEMHQKDLDVSDDAPIQETDVERG